MIGKTLRMGRLFDTTHETTVMVAVSNSMYFGPVAGLETNKEIRDLVRACVDGGCDSVMITPGALRANVDLLSGRGAPAIVLSAGYTNTWRSVRNFGHAGHGGDQTLIASIEEALRLGADAYHLYAFLGWHDDGHDMREMERLGQVCEAAHKWGLPVLCEPVARGDAVATGSFNSVENVALVARLASEIGADMVKVEYTGDDVSFRKVVEASHVPVVVMGGAKTDTFEEFLDSVENTAAIGARGVAVGRNIYSQTDATAAVSRTVEAVRRGASRWVSKGHHV